jgi:hypothetical protein
MLGFGWAGIFRKYLVEPGEMWWPSNLVQVSLFRYICVFAFYILNKQALLFFSKSIPSNWYESMINAGLYMRERKGQKAVQPVPSTT